MVGKVVSGLLEDVISELFVVDSLADVVSNAAEVAVLKAVGLVAVVVDDDAVCPPSPALIISSKDMIEGVSADAQTAHNVFAVFCRMASPQCSYMPTALLIKNGLSLQKQLLVCISCAPELPKSQEDGAD
jgi:hypothetical protein